MHATPSRRGNDASLIEDLVRSVDSSDLPIGLPLGHTTFLGRIEGILASASIAATPCDVHGDERCYFFYGGLFYRKYLEPTYDNLKHPIGLLFEYSVSDAASGAFPFDSGGFPKGVFGEWSSDRMPYSEYHFHPRDDGLRRFVKAVYDSNERYFERKPEVRCANMKARLKPLLDFYSDDRPTVDSGADQRRSAVEVYFRHNVSILQRLIWVGAPHTEIDMLTVKLSEIFVHPNRVPAVKGYHPWPPQAPWEMCALLQEHAHDFLLSMAR